MSIVFSFTGRIKKPETLIETAKKLADERYYQLSAGEDGLRLALCPLGGDLYVNWKKENGLFAQYTVEGSCCSTPAGPGLHKAAVEALDALGIQKLAVEDETEFYQHRDFDRMLQEHFHSWLVTLVKMVSDQFGKDHTNLCLCWDLDAYMPENIPDTVVTPMGRFSVQWLQDTLEQKGVEALAERFFLWYHPGRRDALYSRNLGMNLLWEACYFAPSSRSEEDEHINNAICQNIEMVAQLDPTLPLPRKAYKEVCALAGRTPALPEGPELEMEFEPGFRKGLVIHSIGPLRLVLPGSYQFEWEEWDENSGCHKWADKASHSPIWRVNGYKMKNGNAAFTPVLQNDNDLTDIEVRGGAVRYAWRKMYDKERPYYQVRGEVITGPSLFVITVTYLNEEERAGIVELMRKITANTQDVEKHTVQAER